MKKLITNYQLPITASKGLTLIELMIYAAVLGIITIPLTTFFVKSLKSVYDSQRKTESQEAVRVVLIEIEKDLAEANQIIASSSTAIDFICDYTKHPNYNFYGDTDADGIVNIQDPDDDNDASLIQPATSLWKIGYDLDDDDDDNDNKIDVKIRFYWNSSAKKVYKDAAYNGEAWGNHIEELAVNITSFTLTYLGAKRNDLGRYVDTNNDGIISASEIDSVLPPTGHGNNNGRLDTDAEMKYIVSIGVYLEMDKNSDGITDYKIDTEIMPPLLSLKKGTTPH
ncbi:MAG: prepilin-type N-terminal cleavage/methylation domain-containing protein [Elusimicrobia bacterium]|nr:prepilin-type N-terminal cleavage/methylation domain-containing protein [Elusimicrobiota bacterium]